jgi:hypothetical protein
MIRNLKALVLAVVAVVALGALGATAAQAHTPATFTSGAPPTTLTVLPDGSGKTAHQVLDIQKADGTGGLPITCSRVTGEVTVEGTSFTDVTVTPKFEESCTFLGQSVVVENTGCNFIYTADGTLHITSEFAAAPNTCKHGEKPIEWKTAAPLECKVEIGEQTVTGVKYHNLNAAGEAVETYGQTVTAEQKELALQYNATGKDCPYGTTSNGLFTTGNFILTGDIYGTSTMDNVSWHGAQGGTPATFTSGAPPTTLTVLPDGSGKTSHQVIDIRKADGSGALPITCNQVTGEGTVEGTSFTDVTVTPKFEESCTFLGQSVVVENTGCNFIYTADGTLHITSEFAAAPNTCKHGEKPIEWKTAAPLECKVEIGEQTVTGVKYHNLNAAGEAVETYGQTVTAEQKELALQYNATGKDCPYGTTSNGLFTTGNFILTGELDGTSTMDNVSWHATKGGTPATFTSGAPPTTFTVLPDGSGKTAHQVFEIRKADGTGALPITCNGVTGEGTVEGTSFTDVTVATPKFGEGCTFLGQSVVVENTGCNFIYTADGTLHITSEFAAAPNTCNHGEKPIEWKTAAPLECKVEIGAQTLNGVKYHNLNAAGEAVETYGQTVTVEQKELGLQYNATGKDCPYGTTSNGLFTTGNFILTGELDGTSTMDNVSWHATVA